MIYRSSRNDALSATPSEAVVRGLAPDGGLYTPDRIPCIDWRALETLDYTHMAAKVISALLPDFSEEELVRLVSDAYRGKFGREDITPSVEVGNDILLELFHGPTSAFKDVALCLLPYLMRSAAVKCGDKEEILILTATSGDTGKAALEGFRDVPGIRIMVFFPDCGVSPVQRAQMVTQQGENVKVCAVKGNFDDAQSAVKAIFEQVKDKPHLSSANSINIGRLVPQVVYYFDAYFAAVRMGRIAPGDKLDYCVPTGNFGDILAGYIAGEMGLPVGRLVCASNKNNILTDFIRTGVYDCRREFYRTESPSMDILISSNLERLLRLMSGDAGLVSELMAKLKLTRCYTAPDALMEKIRAKFWAGCCEDTDAESAIGKLWREEKYLCDTHTAVAWDVARQYKAACPDHAPVVILSTASPYKFPAAVLNAIGEHCDGDEFDMMEKLEAVTGVPMPENLRSLRCRPVRHTDLTAPGDMLSYVLKKSEEEKW